MAEVLMIRRLWAAEQAQQQQQQRHDRKARPGPRGLLVLPYLSIVAEKTAGLGSVLAGMKWRVVGYQGERENEGTPLAGKVGGRCVKDAWRLGAG